MSTLQIKKLKVNLPTFKLNGFCRKKNYKINLNDLINTLLK